MSKPFDQLREKAGVQAAEVELAAAREIADIANVHGEHCTGSACYCHWDTVVARLRAKMASLRQTQAHLRAFLRDNV